MGMNLDTRHKRKNSSSLWLLRLLVVVFGAVALYAVSSFSAATTSYDAALENLANYTVPVKTATIGGEPLHIPSYHLLKQGGLWSIVSKQRPLGGEAGFELVDIPIPHGDADSTMSVAKTIAAPLRELVAAASDDGEALMASSAYRSIQEQQAIYDEYVRESGAAAANKYVMPVGASEHHTGLAVDFSSVSSECADDSNTCSLSQNSAAWLAENAWRYGFILRYPDGSQDITGVGFEPWHYRYVGKPMARAVYMSEMTYEAVIDLIAPGFSR